MYCKIIVKYGDEQTTYLYRPYTFLIPNPPDQTCYSLLKV